MRDVALLRFTLHAIRELGAGVARVVQTGPGLRAWHAGPQPLNGQAIQDLVGDGWLRPFADGRDLRIDAWPTFAGIIGAEESMADFLTQLSCSIDAGTAEATAPVEAVS